MSSITFQENIAVGKHIAEKAVMAPSPSSRKEATCFSFKVKLESYTLKAKLQHMRRSIAKFRTGQQILAEGCHLQM